MSSSRTRSSNTKRPLPSKLAVSYDVQNRQKYIDQIVDAALSGKDWIKLYTAVMMFNDIEPQQIKDILVDRLEPLKVHEAKSLVSERESPELPKSNEYKLAASARAHIAGNAQLRDRVLKTLAVASIEGQCNSVALSTMNRYNITQDELRVKIAELKNQPQNEPPQPYMPVPQSQHQPQPLVPAPVHKPSAAARSMIFEVIVRQAMVVPNWERLLATTMQAQHITVQEVREEVSRRTTVEPAQLWLAEARQTLQSKITAQQNKAVKPNLVVSPAVPVRPAVEPQAVQPQVEKHVPVPDTFTPTLNAKVSTMVASDFAASNLTVGIGTDSKTSVVCQLDSLPAIASPLHVSQQITRIAASPGTCTITVTSGAFPTVAPVHGVMPAPAIDEEVDAEPDEAEAAPADSESEMPSMTLINYGGPSEDTDSDELLDDVSIQSLLPEGKDGAHTIEQESAAVPQNELTTRLEAIYQQSLKDQMMKVIVRRAQANPNWPLSCKRAMMLSGVTESEVQAALASANGEAGLPTL